MEGENFLPFFWQKTPLGCLSLILPHQLRKCRCTHKFFNFVKNIFSQIFLKHQELFVHYCYWQATYMVDFFLFGWMMLYNHSRSMHGNLEGLWIVTAQAVGTFLMRPHTLMCYWYNDPFQAKHANHLLDFHGSQAKQLKHRCHWFLWLLHLLCHLMLDGKSCGNLPLHGLNAVKAQSFELLPHQLLWRSNTYLHSLRKPSFHSECWHSPSVHCLIRNGINAFLKASLLIALSQFDGRCWSGPVIAYDIHMVMLWMSVFYHYFYLFSYFHHSSYLSAFSTVQQIYDNMAYEIRVYCLWILVKQRRHASGFGTFSLRE